MTGAVAATAMVTTGAASPGSGHPNAMSWSNVYGPVSGSTQSLTVAGITTSPAPISVAHTGVVNIHFNKNGADAQYAGSFTVNNGDTLGFTLTNYTTGTVSGTITVTSGAFTVGTFTYVLSGTNF